MSKFEDFIKSRQSSVHDTVIDWAKQRDDWLQYLQKFYSVVESALRPFIDAGQVSISFELKEMFEEEIGHYKLNCARIKIGNLEARLDPIGTILLGAKGRVDLVGPNGSVRFVLVDAESAGPKISVTVAIDGQSLPGSSPVRNVENWAWRKTTMPPKITYLPLTEESFLDSLVEVMNG